MNFRLKLDPDYKGHRIQRKPLCHARMLEKVREEYLCSSRPGLEADDMMGILSTQPGAEERIVVSQDKDMLGVPCKLWDKRDLLTINEAEANDFWLQQTLIGDASDGYKGCPRVGKVTAEKIIRKAGFGLTESTWEAVVEAFENAGLTEEDALTQARLARILRWSDWDQEKQEPILWTPDMIGTKP